MSDALPGEITQHYPLPLTHLPAGWERVWVADIASSISPGFASGKHSSDGKGVPHLRPMNIDRDGRVDLAVVKSVASSEGIELAAGDVLFNNTNSPELVGKTALVSEREAGFAYSNHMTRIRLEPGVEPAFVARQLHFLWMSGYLKTRCTNHVNQASISSNSLASTVPLLLAPAAEQKRIVERLEEALSDLDDGVKELKAAQKKLARYRQAVLKAAVDGSLTTQWRSQRSQSGDALKTGAQLLERLLRERHIRWEKRQLAQFSEKGVSPPKSWQEKYREPAQPKPPSDLPLPQTWTWASVEQIAADEPHSLAIGPFGSNLKVSDYRDGGVPLVFVRNIRSRRYGSPDAKYVAQEKADELSAHSVKAGDVLITKMGEPPGDADVYPLGSADAIITADCIKVSCQPGLMRADFFAAVVNSHVGRRQIEPITQGVAQKKVSLGRFSSLAIPLPPIEEQDEIVRLLAEADAACIAREAAIATALRQCNAQRLNLLKSAFSGALTRRSAGEESAGVFLQRVQTDRAKQVAQPKRRRTNVAKRAEAMVRQLVDVLAEVSDWLPAQEVFRRCGVTDGAQTDDVEALYAELRALDKAKRVSVEAVTDAQGRKLYDRLRIVPVA